MYHEPCQLELFKSYPQVIHRVMHRLSTGKIAPKTISKLRNVSCETLPDICPEKGGVKRGRSSKAVIGQIKGCKRKG